MQLYSIHLPPCLRRHRELRVREQPQRGGDEPGGVRGVHRHHARPRPRAHRLDRAHGGGGNDINKMLTRASNKGSRRLREVLQSLGKGPY